MSTRIITHTSPKVPGARLYLHQLHSITSVSIINKSIRLSDLTITASWARISAFRGGQFIIPPPFPLFRTLRRHPPSKSFKHPLVHSGEYIHSLNEMRDVGGGGRNQ
ncbi:hypothetical protein CEXT_740511 [Caerostris extrusa]|uniref:Uncharacterized protein n=1 Tax=Caerostris extrusa TaxID=172846 RepID=A0AAV4YF67_CAEEX|nr:hypothetical protein CEXT_740511 [Caerostris extrusa]